MAEEKFEMPRNETALVCAYLMKIVNRDEFDKMTKKEFLANDPALEGTGFNVYFNENAFEKTNEILTRMLDFLVSDEEALESVK